MNREQRLFLMLGVPLIAVVVVGYLVVDAAGGGGFGGGDMNGGWEFTVGLEEGRFELPEEEIVLRMDMFQDESGYLSGTGSAEYDGREWDVLVNAGDYSWFREDGMMSLSLSGDGEDYDDHFRIGLEGEVPGGGEAEGTLYFDGELESGQDFSGTAFATGFVGERR